MEVEVEPSLQITMAENDAKPYLGRYEYTERDSTGKDGRTSTFIVDYENGTLKAAWDPADNYMKHFALIRIAPDWFVPGLYDKKGAIYEVLRPEMTMEFTRVNGRPMTMELRDEDDKVVATAKRKP